MLEMMSLKSLVLLHAAAMFLQLTGSVDLAATSTVTEGHPIRMRHVESGISSITVNWTTDGTPHTFQVLARSLSSGILLIARPTNETQFTLTELTVDTAYKVCVLATPGSASSSSSSSAASSLLAGTIEDEEAGQSGVGRACLLLSTVPYVRVDSILVLFGVVMFIVLSIVAAIFCWKCSRTEDSSTEDLKANGDAEEEFEKVKKSDEEQQPLLDSSSGNSKSPQNTGEPASEKPDSEAEPINVGLPNSELPADAQADKPIAV